MSWQRPCLEHCHQPSETFEISLPPVVPDSANLP